MSRKPSKSTIAKKAWQTRRKNAEKPKLSTKDMIDKALLNASTQPMEWKQITPVKPTFSFADCIFQIVNSTMDQGVKHAAFEALNTAAANNMRF